MRAGIAIAIAAAAAGFAMSWAAGCNGKPKPPAAPDAKPPPTQPATNPRHQEPGRTYDPRNGFSIVPPPTYAGTAPGTSGFLAFLGSRDWGYTATFTVASRPDDGTAVERIGEAVKNDLSRTQKNYALVREGFVTIDGRKAYTINAQFTQGAYNVQRVQYYLRGNNNRLYVMSFTSHARSFAQHRQAFEAAAITAATD